jgi:hypothetical protein
MANLIVREYSIICREDPVGAYENRTLVRKLKMFNFVREAGHNENNFSRGRRLCESSDTAGAFEQ